MTKVEPLTKTVLFVCVENSFRSVLSEELFNSKAPPGWQAESAGVNPAPAVNPVVRELLNEVGILPTERTPRMVTPGMVAQASWVVTFGCLDRYPIGTEAKGEDWPVPGATGKGMTALRTIRDELSQRVDRLIKAHCVRPNPDRRQHDIFSPDVEGLRQVLHRVASSGGTLTYGELMRLQGISRGRPLFDAIVEVDKAEYARGAPDFAAIIVRRDTGYPGGGFFCDDDLPTSLRRPFSRANDPRLSAAELNYVKEEQKKIWAYYSAEVHK